MDTQRPPTRDSDQFRCKEDGFLYCEELKVKAICEELAKTTDYSSPFYLYSKAQIEHNVRSYTDALRRHGIPYLLGFSMKANNNLEILRLLKSHGCTAVLVSGNELKCALKVGFTADKLIYNGNGKDRWEIELAVEHDVMINADSLFDLNHINEVCEKLRKRARILLRINPDIDPDVHPYISTGLAETKFGIQMKDFDKALDVVKLHATWLDLIGLHCHLGSTISKIDVFQSLVDIMLSLINRVKEWGFDPKYLNIGGGLGINYEKYVQKEDKMPSTSDFIESIAEKLKGCNLCTVLEPGRSIVGNAAILVTKVIGLKNNEKKSFIVVDASMTEVLRPSIYGAYHHIQLIEPTQSGAAADQVFDVVGPVCESADFIGKERHLRPPHEGCGIAVRDVGAYCYSLSSNYNMRLRPAEIMVDGKRWRVIRRAETIDDVMRTCLEVPNDGE
ncbi:uncharacterized protein [Ptychodera flava]|uniref:uncharacterized protein n=1 Tax=Ptychodera flava TaxID=63121 RepID=UPI00396A1F2A